MDLGSVRAFPFTESRIEEAIRLVAAGKAATKADGRRYWRDAGSPHGLILLASSRGGTFYRLSKQAGKKVYVRIGDATAMRLTKAREIALKLAGGDRAAAPPPIRVRTDGITVAQAWAAYIRDTKSGDFIAGKKQTSPATIRSYEDLYNPHLKKQYGAKSLHALARDLEKIHKRFKDRKATGNRLIQVIRNLFTHAIRTGSWDKPNPAIDPATGRGMKKFTVPSRERFLTTDEAARVLAYAETEIDPWRDFWTLLILTGVRASTLRNMRWSQLDLTGEPIWSIPTTKNGNPLVLPLTEWAAEVLRGRKSRAPKVKGKPASSWVFPMKEDRTRPIADLDNAWARVKDNAELEGVRIHDLRRTTGSWATMGGAPLPAVGRLLGHRSSNATAVYARVDVAASRGAAEIVEERLRQAAGKAQEAGGQR